VTAAMHEREADLLAELRTDVTGAPELAPGPDQPAPRPAPQIPHHLTREGSIDGHR
jgi:hypothetical protein